MSQDSRFMNNESSHLLTGISLDYQPPSPKCEGAEVSKMDIRVWAGGYAHGGVCGGVRLSVCLFRGELVRAALTNHREIFGGGQGPCQERLSPEPAKSVKVRARKGREIRILSVSH